MPQPAPEPYRDDLTHIHDAGFTTFAAQTAPWLMGVLQERGWRKGRIVELGCGSGVLAERLIEAGYDVTGYDLSAAMIARAGQRAPQGTFCQASYLDASLPPCVAVVAQGEVFNYLFDRRAATQQLPRLFRRVYQALSPGGLFLFDIAEPGRAGPSGHTRGFSTGDGWACLFAAAEDRARSTLTRTITSFRGVGELYRRDDEVHHLRLLERATVLQQLRAAGFTARVVRRYGEWSFPKGWVGLLARKKA